MKHEQSTFKSADGLDLYYQSWLPEVEPKAVIVIVHGMGEYGGRYRHVVNALVPKGYAIYAADHRGHGRSPGKRMFVNKWSQYLDDLGLFIKLVQERWVGRPFFLYGHSMGGNITLNYVLRHPDGYNAVIASAPARGQAGCAADFGLAQQSHVPIGSRHAGENQSGTHRHLARSSRGTGIRR